MLKALLIAMVVASPPVVIVGIQVDNHSGAHCNVASVQEMVVGQANVSGSSVVLHATGDEAKGILQDMNRAYSVSPALLGDEVTAYEKPGRNTAAVYIYDNARSLCSLAYIPTRDFDNKWKDRG